MINMNKNIVLLDNAIIKGNVEIGEFSIIGKASRPSVNSRLNIVNFERKDLAETIISEGCYIGSHVLVEEGVFIGRNCVIESYCMIGSETKIGNNTFIVHGSRILGKTKINENCVIGGLVAENSIIGSKCRVLGSLLHKQVDPGLSWDDNFENAPVLGDKVFVGSDAKVIGDVEIASFVYICSGATVTEDIPSHSIVRYHNDIIPLSEWSGPLKNSSFWE